MNEYIAKLNFIEIIVSQKRYVFKQQRQRYVFKQQPGPAE